MSTGNARQKKAASLCQVGRPNIGEGRAVVVAQLAEQSLPTPEIRGSNPDIGNKIFERNYLSIAIQKI